MQFYSCYIEENAQDALVRSLVFEKSLHSVASESEINVGLGFLIAGANFRTGTKHEESALK